jgi:hypothetical protein
LSFTVPTPESSLTKMTYHYIWGLLKGREAD